jgi:hypothetical protein
MKKLNAWNNWGLLEDEFNQGVEEKSLVNLWEAFENFIKL